MRSTRDAGMTIVEATVTTALLAVVVTLITTVAISFISTSSENIDRQRGTDTARVAMAKLATNLDRMVAPSSVDTGVGDPGAGAAISQASGDKLAFWAMLGQEEHALSAVTVERCPDGRLVLGIEEETPAGDKTLCDGESAEVLAEGVAPGVFQYYSAVDGQAAMSNPNQDLGKVGALEAVIAVEARSTVVRRFHLTQWKEF